MYDGVSLGGGHKELARVAKILAELLLDERIPPPHHADMGIVRKCAEYLAPCAVSSLAWFVVHRMRARNGAGKVVVAARGVWAVFHRVARQALIYRLFFRMGSVEYSLASLLGIVCCFFSEDLFLDLHRFALWPTHFSMRQGVGAVGRSFLYSMAFSLPLQRLSKVFEESRRRRGNAKKLIFALVLALVQYLNRIRARILTATPRLP